MGFAGSLPGIDIAKCVQGDDLIAGRNRRLDEGACRNGGNNDGFDRLVFGKLWMESYERAVI